MLKQSKEILIIENNIKKTNEQKLIKHKIKNWRIKKQKLYKNMIFQKLIKGNEILLNIKKDIIKNNNLNKSNTFLLFIFIPIFFFSCLTKNIKKEKLISNNEISLLINGNSSPIILNENIEKPSQIYLNNVPQSTVNYSLSDLNSGTNTIRIIWDSPITNCNAMFKSLKNIIFVDLSNLDSSKVTSMSEMFYNCLTLTSINFNNFDTSGVTDMRSMFFECRKLNPLDLTNFNTSSVIHMEQMFFGCNAIKSLYLNNFNTTSVINMAQMFYWCATLESLEINHFNTSSVRDMSLMFQECQHLTSLNISNFDTSSVVDMNNMFYNCYSLTSLDLSNFQTSHVYNMFRMFYQCNSLKFLDISNFDTSSVENMVEMFYLCKSLKSLDISNFNTASISSMSKMFYDCNSLISLELGNFKTSSVTDMSYMFYNCSSLISLNFNSFETSLVTNFTEIFKNIQTSFKYCINDNKESNRLKSQLTSFNISNCSELCSINTQNKYILEKNICINDCANDDTYKFDYNNICYSSCPNLTHKMINSYSCEKDLICKNYYNYNQTDCLDEIPLGYYLNDSSAKTLDKCLIKCNNCTSESMAKNLCITCNINDNYYPKYNDSSNIESFINCYNQTPIGYYLDNSDLNNIFYNPCYITCKKCNQYGNEVNHSCDECFDNYTLKDGNCLKIIDNFTNVITNTENEFTDLITTDSEFTDLITNTENEFTDLITTTDNEFSDLGNSKGTNYLDNETIINSISDIYSEEINLKIKNLPNDASYYQINSNFNDLKNKYKNTSFVYFSSEEISLIYKKFNLDEKKDKIYILISDDLNNDTKSSNYNYNIKLYLEDGKELNLSLIDEDIYVNIYNSVKDLNITNFNDFIYFKEQGYDIYDIYSNFYTDICAPAYLENNDITLKDRKIDFYPNNKTVCKNNCNYTGTDIEEEKIICLCNLNNNKNYTNEDEFLVDDNNENFFNYLLDNINYKLFKCYKLLSTFDNLKKNNAFYGSIIIASVILVIDLIFYLYSVPKLKIKLLRETLKVKKPNIIKMNKNSLIINKKCKKKLYKIKNINQRQNKINKTELNNLKNSCENINKNSDKFLVIKQKLTKNKNILKTKNGKSSTNLNNNLIIKQNSENNNNIKKNIYQKSKKNKNKEEKKEKEELNELPYTLAIIKDKRDIFQIFISLIINKLKIIHLIFGNIEVKIILVYEYILTLLLKFFFNALLYSDEIVSHKYHNNGRLDFIVSIVLSLLSNIITSIIIFYINISNVIEEKLELIIEIKNRKYFYVKNIIKFFKYIKLKFLIHIIIEIIIIPFVFYYLILFYIIYSKSTNSLIINYLTSIVEDIIISILISIIIVLNRKIGINCFNKYFYNTSKYINSHF